MASMLASASSSAFAEMASKKDVLDAAVVTTTSASQVAGAVMPFKPYSYSKSSKPKKLLPSHLSLELQLARALYDNRKLQAEIEQLKTDSALQKKEAAAVQRQCQGLILDNVTQQGEIEDQAADIVRLQEQLQQKDAELSHQQWQKECYKQQMARQQLLVETQTAKAADLSQQCDKQQVQMQVLEQLLAHRREKQQKPQTILDVVSKAIPAAAATATSRLVECSPKPSANSAQPAAADGVLTSTSGMLLESDESADYGSPETPKAADGRATFSTRSSSSGSDDGDSCGSNHEEHSAPEGSGWWWWRSSYTPSTTDCSNQRSGNIFSSWLGAGPQVDIAAGAAGDMLYV